MRRRPRAPPGRAGRTGGGGRGAAGRTKRRTTAEPAAAPPTACPTAKPAAAGPPAFSGAPARASRDDLQAEGLGRTARRARRPASRRGSRAGPAPPIAAMALSGVSAVTVPTAGAVRESATNRLAVPAAPVWSASSAADVAGGSVPARRGARRGEDGGLGPRPCTAEPDLVAVEVEVQPRTRGSARSVTGSSRAASGSGRRPPALAVCSGGRRPAVPSFTNRTSLVLRTVTRMSWRHKSLGSSAGSRVQSSLIVLDRTPFQLPAAACTRAAWLCRC